MESQLIVLLSEPVVLLSNFTLHLYELLNLDFMLINLSLKNLLVVLLSLSASYGRFSVLKSLSGLFVFAWVLKI